MAAAELHPLRLDSSFYNLTNIANDRRIKANCEWQPFRQLSSRIFKGAFCVLQEEYVDCGIPYLRTAEIKPGFVDLAGCVFLSEKLHDRERRTEVRPDNVILAKTGASIGYSAVIPKHLREANICQDLVGVRVLKQLDPYYVQAFLASQPGQTQALRWCQGNAHPHLGLEGIREWVVPVPSDSVCKAIGNKLRKAERLRELAGQRWAAANRQLSGALKLPLEPSFFRAFGQADAATPEYQCTTIDPPSAWALADEAIAAQYYHPRRVRTRKLAKAGGRSERLDELATRLRKSADRASVIGRVIGLDQIDSTTGVIAPTGNPNAEHDGPQAVFEPQTILFSRLRPNLNKVTIWPESWATGGGSGELLAYRANEDVNPYYLFFVLKSPLGLFQVLDVTAGSTLPRVESEVVDSILIPRLTTDAEMQIGAFVRDAHAAWYASAELIPAAKAAVESLIDGTLDEERLLGESAEIETWLKKNPGPYEASGPKASPEGDDA
jgi:type I restriction enzyme S subunit